MCGIACMSHKTDILKMAVTSSAQNLFVLILKKQMYSETSVAIQLISLVNLTRQSKQTMCNAR